MAKAKGKARAAAKNADRKILRAISIGAPGEVVVYTPGMEDQLEEALNSHNESLPEDQQFDVQEELNRLETMGSLVGFGTVDENASPETSIPDPNIRAVKQKVVQQAEAIRQANAAAEKAAAAAENAAEDDDARDKRNSRGMGRIRGSAGTTRGIVPSATTKRAAKRQINIGPDGTAMKIDHGADEIEDDDFEPEDGDEDVVEPDSETVQTGNEDEE